MNDNQSSEIIANSHGEARNIESDRLETVLESQQVSVHNLEDNKSLELKKWLIASGVVLLTIAVGILLAKETDVCLLSTCNDYSDSTATDSTPTSIGNDFIAYAGGATTLVVLTTLVGIPLLPAVAISAGVWFLVKMIH